MRRRIEEYRRAAASGKMGKEELREAVYFLRHERLIHLLITIATGVFWIVAGGLMVITGSLAAGAVFLVLTVVFLFYIRHYCFLENAVQELSDELVRVFGKN